MLPVKAKKKQSSTFIKTKVKEFLSSPAKSNNLVDIMRHMDEGKDLVPCLQALSKIFQTVFEDGRMRLEVEPEATDKKSASLIYKEWLRSSYEEAFVKVVQCCESDSGKVKAVGKLRNLRN